ncbi:MAG TPA: hypothetical protein VEC09_00310 [Actinomycetota bacterium]|jgi:hypothetical protein|nr:hypothetical protein [Actinomycetota bacterium]
MSTVVIVWLVIGLLSAAVTTAMLIALIRHVLVLGRAIGRFGAEVSPIADEIAAQTKVAGGRSQRMAARPPTRSRGGPAVR